MTYRGKDRRKAEQIVAHAAIEEVTELAVKKIFKNLGIDLDDVKAVRRFNDNIGFISRLRLVSEKVGIAITVTVFSALAASIMGLVWIGFKSKIGN